MDEEISIPASQHFAYIMDCIVDLDSQVNEFYDKIEDMIDRLDDVIERVDRITEG